MDTIRSMAPEQIKRLRESLGETQKVFAERFERSVRSVENWEQGVCRPDALVLRELCRLADGDRHAGRKRSTDGKGRAR